jgi:hypothetical protein
MTVRVSISQGLGYRVGQPLYFGGQWLRIDATYPVMEQGRIIGYNVILTKLHSSLHR